MKISSEVREHWTQYLQGQLPVSEQEALGRRLETDQELAATLTADAHVHQLLLDHFSTQPTLLAVLATLPDRSFGSLTDRSFVARCVGIISPPVFEGDGGITFAEPHSVPPVAIEPPPFCEPTLVAVEQSWIKQNRRGFILAVLVTMVMLAAGGWWFSNSPLVTESPALSVLNQLTGVPAHVQPSDDHLAGVPLTGVPLDDAPLADEEPPPLEPAIAQAVPPAVEQNPIVRAEPDLNRFPQVIRGAVDQEPNFIKDTDEAVHVGPQQTKLPVGQLIAGGDAQWQAEPNAWGLPPQPASDHAANDARTVRLMRGEAQIVFDCGLRVGMQAPAAIQFVSPTKLRLIAGNFLVEPASDDAALDWSVATDCFDIAPVTASRFFVTTSAQFGSGVEILQGEGRLTPHARLGEPTSLSQAGFFAGHFLPTADAATKRPGAAALARRDGTFLGRIVAFQSPLLISSSEVFGATLPIIVKRMREAPANFSRDWSHVLDRLEKLKTNNRNRPKLRHEVQFSGDLLPAFPELQTDLGRGIPAPQGPFDVEQIRQIAGQLNLNGQLINLDNMDELRNIQQELANELRQLRAQQEQMRGNRNRRNAMDPDFMAQQMIIQQMQQIEMILRLAQGFQQNLGNPPGMGPQLIAPEPVMAPFTGLFTPEGQQDRAALVEKLERALEESLEDETQRAERLQRLREKLHQQ
jgi:hypothetical protein